MKSFSICGIMIYGYNSEGMQGMGYVIIDLEFNNMQNITRYYPNMYEKNKHLRTLEVQNEILEIGAVKLDENFIKIDEYKVYIKPAAFTVLNPKITDITGITNKDLRKAVSLAQGMNGLKKFAGIDNIICSWATDDIAEIVINAKFQKYDDVYWIEKYLDLQNYCTKILAYKKPIGLKVALNELKIEVDKEKLHDALNDADYTAEVLRKIYKKELINDFIVDNVYDLPSVKVKDLRNYNPENIKLDFKCKDCDKALEVVEPLSILSNKFMSLGKCKKCDAKYVQEVILKKTIAGGIIYNDKTTKLDNYDYFQYSYKFKNSRK
ncbi:MAG: exonuclease domain-containing protein [Sarcina sp.]